MPKCPVCGFDGCMVNEKDQIICGVWLYKFLQQKDLPTKEQYEALQREGFLPTQVVIDDRTCKISYNDCGWANHDWSSIAEKIQKVWL